MKERILVSVERPVDMFVHLSTSLSSVLFCVHTIVLLGQCFDMKNKVLSEFVLNQFQHRCKTSFKCSNTSEDLLRMPETHPESTY